MLSSYRDQFASEMGLPLSARFQHSDDDIDRAFIEVRQQHPEHTKDEAMGRALARLDALKHERNKRTLLRVTKEHDWRRWAEIAFLVGLILLVLALSIPAHCQGSTTVRGAAKGTTPAATATVTAADANHNGVDVNIVGGGGSGGTASTFGAAFPATGTAVGAKNGSSMVNLAADGSNNLLVNCIVGCAGGSTTPSDAFANPTTAGIQFGLSGFWNGTTWDRVRGDTTNGLWVNVKNFPSLPAGSNVIGHIIADTGSTTAVTGNVTAVQATGSNLHVAVDSAPTTAVTNAGLTNLDVALSTRTKPADQQHAIIDSGTTVVTQGTGSNLHVAVDSAPTTAVTSTQLPAALDGSGFLKTHEQGVAAIYLQDPVTGTQAAVKAANTPATVTGDPSQVVQNPWELSYLASIYLQNKQAQGRAIQIQGVTTVQGMIPVYQEVPPASYDACAGPDKANVPVSVTANTRLVIGRSGKLARICSIVLVSSSAETFSIVEGTGSTCGTSTAAVVGSTTAANGPSIAANQGYSQGNGGAWIASANNYGTDICILISGATLIAGNMTVAF